MLTNYLGFTQKLESGEDIGSILPFDLVENEEVSQGVVSRVVTNKHPASGVEEEKQRGEKLREILKKSWMEL